MNWCRSGDHVVRDGLLLAGIVAFGAAGCGDGGDAPVAPTDPEVTTGSTEICPASATYGVTFRATWDAASHGSSPPFPSGAHFSRVVGATHVEEISFWSSGGIATGGIESMAETGAVTAFCNEVQAEVDGGRAGGCIRGQEASFRSPGTVTLAFDVDEGSAVPDPGVDDCAQPGLVRRRRWNRLAAGRLLDAADRDGSRRLRRGDGQRNDVRRPRRRRHPAPADRADRRPSRDACGKYPLRRWCWNGKTAGSRLPRPS